MYWLLLIIGAMSFAMAVLGVVWVPISTLIPVYLLSVVSLGLAAILNELEEINKTLQKPGQEKRADKVKEG